MTLDDKRVLTLVIVGGNSGFDNIETGGLETVGHDAVPATEHRSNIQTANSVIGYDVRRTSTLRC